MSSAIPLRAGIRRQPGACGTGAVASGDGGGGCFDWYEEFGYNFHERTIA